MSAVLKKPELRGFLAKRIKFHLVAATVSSLAVGFVFKLLYVDPRRKRNADFHKTYNPDRHLQVMKEHGLLQSCPLET
ncbi:cytochrome c oxidase subunit 6C-like [Diachasmimorpha longicaudata]|uniref:cytochrome c oxidase subunit 6C-like n=1 Tax=Diachasmimorpha longicaudata TaxID=58733 RepID=UPI0030B911B7